MRGLLALAAVVVVLAVAVFGGYVYVGYKRLGNLDRLREHQASREAGEGHNDGKVADGDASKPMVVPVSSRPAPAATIPPADQPASPEIVPSNDDNRAAATALAVAGQNNSPAALLTQLTMPAVKAPGDGNTPLASPAPGGDASLAAHASDKEAEIYRAVAPKPQKVSNNALE